MSVNDSNNISRTDWTALEAMTDEEIDYSEIPPLTEEFFEHRNAEDSSQLRFRGDEMVSIPGNRL